MPLVDLDAIPQVPLDFVNADHRQEAHLLNEVHEALAAQRAGRVEHAAVLACLDALVQHTREHFGREDDAMRRAAFPPYPVHHGEHQRVLAEMERERAAYAEGNDAARLARYLAEVVPAWFVHHIQSMDLMTARFVASSGG
jgi:hemerythrin